MYDTSLFRTEQLPFLSAPLKVCSSTGNDLKEIHTFKICSLKTALEQKESSTCEGEGSVLIIVKMPKRCDNRIWQLPSLNAGMEFPGVRRFILEIHRQDHTAPPRPSA